jgi:hypothetical protein
MIWTPVVAVVILGGEFLICNSFDLNEATFTVVMIIRIHAMYLGSKKILVFLVVSLLLTAIATGVLLAKVQSDTQSGKCCMKESSAPSS